MDSSFIQLLFSTKYKIYIIFTLINSIALYKSDIVQVEPNLGVSCPSNVNSDSFPQTNFSRPFHTHLNSYYSAIDAINNENHKQAFHFLNLCSVHDIRCQSLLAEHHFLGRPPLKNKNFAGAILLWKYAADNGSADAQFYLALLYSNIFNMPSIYRKNIQSNDTSNVLKLKSNGELDFVPLSLYYNGDEIMDLELQLSKDWSNSTLYRNDALAITYLYSASLAGHPGALIALGYRYEFGYGVSKSCSTASLYYLELAKKISKIYASSVPQAVELISFEIPGKYHRQSQKIHQLDLILHEAEQGQTSMQATVGRGCLLGIYGLKQDYTKAYYYLNSASQNNHWESTALLGYMHALGLGVPADLDSAAEFFIKSQTEYKETLGQNGMGYVYFFGTEKYPRDYKKAFEHFSESAHAKLPDAQFNLGCLYMTGTGVEKSISTALHWFTSALIQGHTPAAFTLALIHLTGISIPSMGCENALALLKRVCSNGNWYTVNSRKAIDYEASRKYDESAFALLKLAETGDEKAQTNLAHLLEKQSNLFKANHIEQKRIYANRFYQMAYDQDSIAAMLKLGDFAFYGWGVNTHYSLTPNRETLINPEGEDLTELVMTPNLYFYKRSPNYLEAAEYYRLITKQSYKTSQKWLYPYLLRASHNLAIMRMFGIGLPQDFNSARQELVRVLILGEHVPIMPIQLTLYFLYFLELYYNSSLDKIYQLFNWKYFRKLKCIRIVVIIIFILLILRKYLSIKLQRSRRQNNLL